jgi:hypothetical protein
MKGFFSPASQLSLPGFVAVSHPAKASRVIRALVASVPKTFFFIKYSLVLGIGKKRQRYKRNDYHETFAHKIRNPRSLVVLGLSYQSHIFTRENGKRLHFFYSEWLVFSVLAIAQRQIFVPQHIFMLALAGMQEPVAGVVVQKLRFLNNSVLKDSNIKNCSNLTAVLRISIFVAYLFPL